MRLTDLSIRALKPPERGQVTHGDDLLPGFGVRVSQGGTKSFVLVHGHKRERVTLGRYPVLSLSEAREKARGFLSSQPEQKAPSPAFRETLALFLTVHCKQRNRLTTAKEAARLLNRHFLPKLAERPFQSITTDDLLRITDSLIATPSEANHAFTAARTLFRWATQRRYIVHNPLEGAKLPAKATLVCPLRSGPP